MNPRLTMNIDAEYRFSRAIGLFLDARNITGEPFVVGRYGPNTPAYARRFERTDYGIAIPAGLKARFDSDRWISNVAALVPGKPESRSWCVFYDQRPRPFRRSWIFRHAGSNERKKPETCVSGLKFEGIY